MLRNGAPGTPTRAEMVLRWHLGRLRNALDHSLEQSGVPESLLWASGVDFSDFRVLAFPILGSVLVPFE